MTSCVGSAVGAGDATASHSNFLGKIWADLGKSIQNFRKSTKILENMLGNYPKFEQNQKLASPKTFDLLRLCMLVIKNRLYTAKIYKKNKSVTIFNRDK